MWTCCFVWSFFIVAVSAGRPKIGFSRSHCTALSSPGREREMVTNDARVRRLRIGYGRICDEEAGEEEDEEEDDEEDDEEEDDDDEEENDDDNDNDDDDDDEDDKANAKGAEERRRISIKSRSVAGRDRYARAGR